MNLLWNSILSNHKNNTTISKNLLFIDLNNKWSEGGSRWWSEWSNQGESEAEGENAYEMLGVSETSSLDEIKASFQKLAKLTHPDLSGSASSSSRRFVQILAAYQILSDSEKRAHYDKYLFSQRNVVPRRSREGPAMYAYKTQMVMGSKQMEVVEWLRWYRLAINDILAEKKVVAGTGYFQVLDADFHSAIHAAYYGPEIESWDLLPDCFEAEERSVDDTSELLHLVSGRDLFGMVCLVNKNPRLSSPHTKKLDAFPSIGRRIFQSVGSANAFKNSAADGNKKTFPDHASDEYGDLELHVSGRVVATASRIPPESYSDGVPKEDAQDRIDVFLCSDDNSMRISKELLKNSFSGRMGVSKMPIGSILGLGTSPDEGSCFVCDSHGRQTHVIMKHRTLLVKHMHWYELGDNVSICECRCSRARLPPSKFWLFEPRCDTHDIGGWYVETFGRDKKGRTVPSQRYWDGLDENELYDSYNGRRLHPAMYLLALAYRTLDLEDAKRRNQTFGYIVQTQVSRILQWCKRLI